MPGRNKICVVKGCGNRAISFSDRCGLHTPNRIIKSALKKLNKKKIQFLNLNELELKGISLNNKEFNNAQFGEIEFERVAFIDCKFKFLNAYNITFSLCQFKNCQFKECEFKDVDFDHCDFINCTFDFNVFNQSSFWDDTVMDGVSFNDTSFTGGTWQDLKNLEKITFKGCIFSQIGIISCNYNNSIIAESEFYKTTIYDCKIFQSQFINDSNDFLITGSPKLCDFTGTTFKDTKLPKVAKSWNLFKGKRLDFFLSIVEKISSYQHPNFLPELSLSLERLREEGFTPDYYFKNQVMEIFRKQFSSAGERNDFLTAGKIISEYGKLPSEYKISGLALPAPRNNQEISEFQSCLYLQLDMGKWTVDNIHRVYSYFSKLSKVLPDSNHPIVVSDILRGSFLQTWWGDLRQLFYCGRVLDLEKLEIEIENQHLEKEIKKIELQKQKEALGYSRIEKERDDKKLMLEQEKLELELFEKKLSLLEAIEKKFGLNSSEYLKTEEGLLALQIADNLQKDFPIISIKLKILNSQKRSGAD